MGMRESLYTRTTGVRIEVRQVIWIIAYIKTLKREKDRQREGERLRDRGGRGKKRLLPRFAISSTLVKYT